MTTTQTSRLPTRNFSSPLRWAIHCCIILAVFIAPPTIYDIASSSKFHDVKGLHFIGALIYPLYIVYWTSKISSFRLKFLTIHLELVLGLFAAVLLASDRSTPLIILSAPTLIAIFPLVSSIFLFFTENKKLAITCLMSSAASIPVGLAATFLLIYNSAMYALSAIPS
ncbi:MAG: hypothetical protein DI585_07340 [Pseudomonas fluorescens]|nr:MAG: hypothetical protein DI585_07340 [Pseudomonas fluorescens]